MAVVSFDIDGTLAEGPFDKGGVEEMAVRAVPIRVLRLLHRAGYRIRVVTARPDRYREQTLAWLRRNAVPYHELRMRASGDNRQDPELRAEQAAGSVVLFDDRPDNCDRFGGRCVRV
jgi:phosphoglycolate phosphatase-like HAD superfamily hydrolase